MKRHIAVLIMILIVGGTSCDKDAEPHIDDELLFYFNLFEEAASERGIIVDVSSVDLSGYVENIKERGTLGQCKSYSDDSKEIIVDESYWNGISNLEKEYLVFHELGHCMLERSHLNDSSADGTCLSIMQSGNNGCKSSYNLENRSLLLDELFGQ